MLAWSSASLAFSSRRALVFLMGLALATTLSACGRSSILGGSPEDCPPGNDLPQCHNHHDMGGDGSVDGGQDGFTSCDTCSTLGCDQPGCCACAACEGALFCQNTDGGTDGGDGGNPCQTVADCSKPECIGLPLCITPGTEICNNGIDDNDNGLIDCADPECSTFPGCQVMTCPTPPDCTLPVCVTEPACQNLRCMPTVDFGSINPTNSTVTKMVNTTGTKDVTTTPCAPGGGGMVVGQFTLTGQADVTLNFTQAMGEDHVFGLFQAGIDQPCGANPVSCYDPSGATSGVHAFADLPAGHYYIIVQAFEPAGQGAVSVTLSTSSTPEICNNGIDDNNNGLIDCQEASCFTAPNCVTQECKTDINLGALVLNAPGQTATFTTVGSHTNNDLICEADPGGGDIVVAFTLAETAGIQVVWSQTGDHILGLVRLPPAGEPCDANTLSCYDPDMRTMDDVAFDTQPAGNYAIIFKATKPGAEGQITATISAFGNRSQELCHNGIDDNNNGLIDCQDPECFGVSGCSAPLCQPDFSLGTLNPGDVKTVNFNIAAKGIANYDASCAHGGGKGMVAQFTAGGTGGIGVTFQCTQTGSQVLSLYQTGTPRQSCDVNEIVCADPTTLPFGCNYEVPNLQPGEYNVIAEAFQPGDEGTMNLTLGVVDDILLEICNNGIDDDMNGKIDCEDLKCATSPDCAAVACKPSDTINPMPLTGTKQFELVQTANNGVLAKPSCETTTGGQAAVVQITLTAEADLTIGWNQVGNHDFALYTDAGQGLPCDAGTQLTCTKSNDAPTGTLTFPAVPQGTLYLVVAADAPDTGTVQSSGSVSLSISGVPTP